MCHPFSIAAAVLITAESGIIGGDSKIAVNTNPVFCRTRFSARKSCAEKNGRDAHSLKDMKSRVDYPQLRSNYGFDQYGSEDASYSTITYAEGAGYHPNHAVDYGGGWDEDDVKWGGVSVSSVFQMSLTALAFLAFGGFLVNLIVQAIKDTKNNDSGGGMTTMSPETLVLVPLKRPKSERRKENEKERGKQDQSEDLNNLSGRVTKLLESFPYED